MKNGVGQRTVKYVLFDRKLAWYREWTDSYDYDEYFYDVRWYK